MKKIKCFSQRQISRPVLWASVIALLLGAAAYPNLGALQPAQNQTPAPPVEAKGPIIEIVMASSIDDKGQIVNPRFTFPPNEPQISDIITAKAVFNTPQPTPTPQIVIGPVTAIITAKGVFDPDLAEVKPGPLIAAIKQLKATAKCRPPRIEFSISVPLYGDSSFASALAKA